MDNMRYIYSNSPKKIDIDWLCPAKMTKTNLTV